MGRGQKIGIFSFLAGTCRPCTTAIRLGTAMTLDRLQAHTQAQADNAHCADEIETDVGADGPVHDTGTHTIHGYGKRGPWAGEKRNMTAYIYARLGGQNV